MTIEQKLEHSKDLIKLATIALQCLVAAHRYETDSSYAKIIRELEKGLNTIEDTSHLDWIEDLAKREGVI